LSIFSRKKEAMKSKDKKAKKQTSAEQGDRKPIEKELAEGIKIRCQKNPLQWQLVDQPYCIINGTEKKSLRWDDETFISLLPDKTYQISVEFYYMGSTYKPGTISTTVKKGEVQRYEYEPPAVMSTLNPGRIVGPK